jgi:hypothetical protein
MDDGGIGVLLVVVPPVEKGLNFGPDSATVQPLLMEDKIAPEKVPIPLLATQENAVIVKQFLNYIIQTYDSDLSFYIKGKIHFIRPLQPQLETTF